jgi:hypothetical protein
MKITSQETRIRPPRCITKIKLSEVAKEALATYCVYGTKGYADERILSLNGLSNGSTKDGLSDMNHSREQ